MEKRPKRTNAAPKGLRETGPTREKYEYFGNEHKRHDIYEFSKELSIYLQENSIKNIIFLDRSARPAWVGVDEYWNQHHKPDTPKPGFYFVNPDGFVVRDGTLISDMRQVMLLLDQLMATGSLSPEQKTKTTREVGQRFSEVYPNLIQEKDEPLVVFDTCSHTGGTIKPVIAVLEHLGFSDVRVITANEPDWDSGIEPDALIDGETRLTSCYPFGNDSLVKKKDDVVSVRNENANQQQANLLRSEIRRIVREEGKN